MKTAPALLQARSLNVSIAGREICKNLDLDFCAGMTVGILGPNGVGKTTLLHTLAGLRRPKSGGVLLEERGIEQWSPKQRAQRLAIMFQEVSASARGTVLQFVLAGRHPHLPSFALESPDDVRLARKALAATGLDDRESQYVASLSGGERKRLALALLITQETRVNLLDEPNSHLDIHYQIQTLERVNQHISSHNGLAVMVLHDVNLLLRFCSHALLVFGDGGTCFGRTAEIINSSNLERLYNHPMLEITQHDKKFFLPA